MGRGSVCGSNYKGKDSGASGPPEFWMKSEKGSIVVFGILLEGGVLIPGSVRWKEEVYGKEGAWGEGGLLSSISEHIVGNCCCLCSGDWIEM